MTAITHDEEQVLTSKPGGRRQASITKMKWLENGEKIQ